MDAASRVSEPAPSGTPRSFRFLRGFLMPLSLLAGLACVTFILTFLAPGDPARVILGPNAKENDVAALREKMGLNRPVAAQFTSYIAGVVSGRWGDSWTTGRPVLREISEHLGSTVTLGSLASVFSIAAAIGLNALFFLRPVSSRVLLPILRFGITVPGVVAAMAAALLSGRLLTWIGGSGPAGQGLDLLSWLPPALAVGIYPACLMTTLLRDRFAQIQATPYFRASQAAGYSSGDLLKRVLLKNSGAMLITAWINQVSLLAFSTIIVEHVFSFRGIGSLLVRSIQGKDFPVLSGIVLLNGIFFLLIQAAGARFADSTPASRRRPMPHLSAHAQPAS